MTNSSFSLQPSSFSLAGCLAASGLGVSILFGLLSPEGILHFDDLTHYLYAKWAWQWPAYLLDDWGRPGFTALYFFPAKIGWQSCRLLSAVLTAASAWLAFRVAQRMGLRHAWGVVPLCYAQPLFFQLSQTTLTETALAFYLTLALYLAQRGRWSLSAAILSIGFVTRHEAIIFLPVWVWFAWQDGVGQRKTPPNQKSISKQCGCGTGVSPVDHHGRNARATEVFHRGRDARATGLWRLWPILWAPLVVNGLAILAGMRPAMDRLLEAAPTTQYGYGGWLTFFCRSMEAWGPGVTVLTMTGLGAMWKKARGGGFVVACVVIYFAAQTIIRALGLFDSGGYARFLVAISPLVAIVALVGWQRLWAVEARARRAALILAAASMVLLWLSMEQQLVLFSERGGTVADLPELHRAVPAVRIAAAAVVLLAIVSVIRTFKERAELWHRRLTCGPKWYAAAPVPAALSVLMLLASYSLCHPLWRPVQAEIIDDLRQWLADRGLEEREIISAHVWLDYATGRELPPDRPTVREQLERAPIGTLFAWERQFAGSEDHGLRLKEFTDNDRAFRLIHETNPAPFKKEPYLRIFKKTGAWGPCAAETSRQSHP